MSLINGSPVVRVENGKLEAAMLIAALLKSAK